MGKHRNLSLHLFLESMPYHGQRIRYIVPRTLYHVYFIICTVYRITYTVSRTTKQVVPSLLGLPSTAGTPPSKAFATLETCRTIPGARVSLMSSSITATSVNKMNAGVPPANKIGDPSPELGEVEEVLEVKPPAGSGGKVLELRVLDVVSLRVSERL